MVFLVDETFAKATFLPLGATLCPHESIIRAQTHVKLILTPIIHAKVIQQPVLGPIGFWIIKVWLLRN